MAQEHGSFAWVPGVARIALILSVIFALLGFAGCVAAIILAFDADTMQEVVVWVLGGVALVVLAVWCLVAYGVIRVVVANEDGVNLSAARLGRIEALLEDQGASVRKLIDLASLSDRTKSLLYREKEVEAFRETIHEDLMKQDYKSAEVLVDAAERESGFADEAARMREEIAASRQKTVEEKTDASVARILDLADRKQWAQAHRETHRLLRLFPENPKVASLPERITKARNEHKRGLLKAYGEAVRKNDVERGIELLRKLDVYLTPQEAAALEESARGVFKARLHNLGVQFSILVTDQQWQQAVDTGRQIMREFPNSRMAQEVRAKMDQLRARASGLADEAEA